MQGKLEFDYSNQKYGHQTNLDLLVVSNKPINRLWVTRYLKHVSS